MADKPQQGEFALIEEYFAPLAKDTPGALALEDDAGCLTPPEGYDLVLTTDMIVEGQHYLETASARDVAYKALAVNVSDLVAKGAQPMVYLLSIALGDNPGPGWLADLREGFSKAQKDFGCGLLGGDTVKTPGPVSLSITAVGCVPSGKMIQRSGAREGDAVYVTGTIGDAALGLALLKGEGGGQLRKAHVDYLESRYWRPSVNVSAVEIVRKYASAAMDVSDGLVGDFEKLCTASAKGGMIEALDVPLSTAAGEWLAMEPERLLDALTGGDDYQVLMAVAEDDSAAMEKECSTTGLRIKSIGRITPGDAGVRVTGPDGKELSFARKSHDHF